MIFFLSGFGCRKFYRVIPKKHSLTCVPFFVNQNNFCPASANFLPRLLSPRPLLSASDYPSLPVPGPSGPTYLSRFWWAMSRADEDADPQRYVRLWLVSFFNNLSYLSFGSDSRFKKTWPCWLIFRWHYFRMATVDFFASCGEYMLRERKHSRQWALILYNHVFCHSRCIPLRHIVCLAWWPSNRQILSRPTSCLPKSHKSC